MVIALIVLFLIVIYCFDKLQSRNDACLKRIHKLENEILQLNAKIRKSNENSVSKLRVDNILERMDKKNQEQETSFFYIRNSI